MSIILASLALFGVGTVAGAMTYESLVEIGIRRKNSATDQLQNWKQVFPVASGLFKPLGIGVFPLLLLAGYLASNPLWYVASAVLISVQPFTSLFIAATNAELIAMKDDERDDMIISKIERWGRLHHVRTLLMNLAFIISLIAFVQS